MASSRMIVTKKRGVFMAHVCSGCGFPRVTAVLIEATAEKSYSISRSYAEQIASETAENAIQAEIKAIDTCYSTRQPLVGSHKGNGMISPGYFCNSSFRGHMSPCPKCFNLEPWQFSNAEKVMDELEVDNFPTVFTDAKEAEEWAIDKVKEHMEIIDIMRTSEKTRKDAAIKVNDSKLKIKLNSTPFVRQYGILLTNGVLLYAKREAKQEIHRGV